MTAFKRSDVVLVLFPNSDLLTFKKRPALIVQADDLQTGIPQVIVALITSNLARQGHPSRVFVSMNSYAGTQSGLRTDSVVVTDNLATVRHHFVEKVIGTLPDTTSIDSAISHTFGLRHI
jgi:mRNA interferase MazF